MTTTTERPVERRQFTLPDRSYAQRMTAIERANDIRIKRARLKRDIKARRVSAAAVLLDPPEWTHTMKVIDVLLAIPKYGDVKACNTLSRNAVSVVKTVGGLTRRQRLDLVASLGYGASEGDGEGMVGALRSGVAGVGRGSRPGEGESQFRGDGRAAG